MWIHLLTLELIDGAGGAVAAAEAAAPSGVHRARFLRRSKRLELPWEEIEDVTDDGVVVKSRRKRIPLPEIARVERAMSPIPVEKFVDLPAIEITIPGLGTARLEKDDEEDEDDILWMM